MVLLGLAAGPAMAQETPRARATQPAPAAPQRLTFEQALRRALEANPIVNRARQDVEAASATKRGVLASVLPHISLNASTIRNTDEVAFGFGDETRTVLPRNDWNYRLTLSQPVFAGLRDMRANAQAAIGIDRAREGVRAAEDALLLRTAADYLGVVEAQLLLEVERQGLALAGQRRLQAQNVYEAGEATRVDVLRAETSVRAAERRVVAAQQQLEASKGRLRIDLGQDGGDMAVDEPLASSTPIPADESTLVRYADQQRAEVRQADHAVRVAELEVAKQKGAYWPVITADAGFISQKTTFPKDRYGFAALRFNVPIFQSGEVGARVAVARSQQRQAELSLEDVRRTVREEVHVAVLGLQAARTNLSLAEEQLETSEAEYAQTFELYKSQEATSVDLAISEAALRESRRGVVQSRLDVRLAELRVWAAAGGLKTALGL
jgi:outer membrane protein